MKTTNNLKFFAVVLIMFFSTMASAQTIYEVQFTEEASGDSPMVDEVVTLNGIVTAVFWNGFWIQDEEGAWNGIYIFDDSEPSIGDDVTVTGTVQEFFNLTEIGFVSSVVINSSGNELPAPTVVTTAEMNAELYEGVYVTTTAVCTNNDVGFGQWAVDDGSGETFVNDLMYAFTATNGVTYNLTGVMNYSFDERKLEPRSAEDVQALVSVEEANDLAINIFPNPVVDILNFQFNGNDELTVEIYSMDGKLVTSNRIFQNNQSMDLSELTLGVYNLVVFNETFRESRLINKK